jgi:hypothetical protein
MDQECSPLSWGEQNALGRKEAEDVIIKVMQERNPLPLNNAARRFIERGSFDGVAVGFFHRIGTQIL